MAKGTDHVPAVRSGLRFRPASADLFCSFTTGPGEAAIGSGDARLPLYHVTQSSFPSFVDYNTASTGVLFSNTTGPFNTAIGVTELQSNTSGDNTARGWAAGFSATTGDGNVYVGASGKLPKP